jgi:hypothetical protein
MIVRAWDDRVPAGSMSSEVFMAARTSGGRSVDALIMSWSTLSKNDGSMVMSRNFVDHPSV